VSLLVISIVFSTYILRFVYVFLFFSFLFFLKFLFVTYAQKIWYVYDSFLSIDKPWQPF